MCTVQIEVRGLLGLRKSGQGGRGRELALNWWALTWDLWRVIVGWHGSRALTEISLSSAGGWKDFEQKEKLSQSWRGQGSSVTWETGGVH